MTADDRLDQAHWPSAWDTLASSPTGHRAWALMAASTWLAGVDPYPTGRRQVLDVAEEFAAWLADDERSET